MAKGEFPNLLKIAQITPIQGVFLVVMTGPFVLQVLTVKANKISNAATAGL